jgi:hypothetical protein
LFRKLRPCSVEDPRPDFGRRERHGVVYNFGEAGQRSYPSRVEKANDECLHLTDPTLYGRFT